MPVHLIWLAPVLLLESRVPGLTSCKKVGLGRVADSDICKSAGDRNTGLSSSIFPKNMRKNIIHIIVLLAVLLLISPASVWAQGRFFADAPDLRGASGAAKKVSTYRVYRLDLAGLKASLTGAPVEFVADSRPAINLTVPMPNGTTETFALYESPILAPAVAKQYPNIKTYTGRAITAGSSAVIRFSFTDGGFNGIVLGVANEATVYFEKLTLAGEKNAYLSYSTLDVLPKAGAPVLKKNPCGVESRVLPIKLGGAGLLASRAASSGSSLRTLRLAVAATGAFTNAKGTPNNTAVGGFTAVVQYVNRIVAVYRRELSVSFTLVSDASIVYTVPGAAPFPTPSDHSAMIAANQKLLDDKIGDANYDVGHVLGYGGNSSGGGVALSPSIGTTGAKGSGITDVNEAAPGQYFTAVFGDQVFAHELGHQFGMSHSFNSSIPVCTTRSPENSVEPGAGTTIMSYGYTCADNTDPAKNDDYEAGYLPFLNFHAQNLAQANALLASVTCYTTTATNNAAPVINSFTTGKTIPKSTPFVLTASATSANANNVLSYSWEGMDTGGNAATPPGPTVLNDETLAPFFRSYEPVATSTRLFPRLAAQLTGANKAKGDKLPAVGQVVNLRLTVRDNVGGVSEVNSAITVDGTSGPFVMTADLNGTFASGATQPVTWSVNNTTAAPVSCANVNILLSIDGGQTFPYTLAAATPNTGSATVTLPALATTTTTARLKVQASNNIFYDISNFDFTITAALNTVSTGPIAGAPFCTGTAVSVPYTITGTYDPANTFQAQLSNATGGFGAPVVIGTLANMATAGTISANIPTSTSAGTGYRIRVIAANPATTGTDNGTDLTVTAPQTAGFSYGASSYCTSSGVFAGTKMAAGATAGTFTSTTGLSLNATNGAVAVATSTPGMYTVTNTVAASGGCAAVSATTMVTITAPQTAGFGYAATSYCTSATGIAAATLMTGATAGTFTSTSGLSLDAPTGNITASTSTPGTYTVTNTVAASGGCAVVTATSTVTISAPQSAAFTFPTTPASYCSDTATPLTPTLGAGAVAGTFALANSTGTGASINPTTGVVNLSAATAGTFTITNTLPATGGCAMVVATQTLTVTPLPATPVLALAGSNTVSVQGGAVAGLVYQFLLNGTAVGSATAAATYQVTSVSANGQYTVIATNAAGCASAPSAAVAVSFVATATALATTVGLQLYPNPAPLGAGVTAELRGWVGSATFRLYDVLGRVVLTAPAAQSGPTHLNLTGLGAGIYWLRAQSASQQASQRLLVK